MRQTGFKPAFYTAVVPKAVSRCQQKICQVAGKKSFQASTWWLTIPNISESHLACKPFLCNKVLQCILFINQQKTSFMLLQTLIIRTVLIIRYFPSLFLKQWLNSHILLQFLWFSLPFLVLNKLVYVCILCVFYLIIIYCRKLYSQVSFQKGECHLAENSPGTGFHT